MQQTAYEMRISYWSSDVCSSGLCFTAPGSCSLSGPQPGSGLNNGSCNWICLRLVFSWKATCCPCCRYLLQTRISWVLLPDIMPGTVQAYVKSEPLQIGRAHV